MNAQPFAEVEACKNDPKVYRALLRFRYVINLMISSVRSGRVTLVSGAAIVSCAGLTTETLVVATHAQQNGDAGLLMVDPAMYDIRAKTFRIVSTSTTDASVVSWLATG